MKRITYFSRRIRSRCSSVNKDRIIQHSCANGVTAIIAEDDVDIFIFFSSLHLESI